MGELTERMLQSETRIWPRAGIPPLSYTSKTPSNGRSSTPASWAS